MHDSLARQRLAAYLARDGLSQEALAARVGVRRGRIQKWLAGASEPQVRAAVALDRATDGAIRPEDWAAPSAKGPGSRPPGPFEQQSVGAGIRPATGD